MEQLSFIPVVIGLCVGLIVYHTLKSRRPRVVVGQIYRIPYNTSLKKYYYVRVVKVQCRQIITSIPHLYEMAWGMGRVSPEYTIRKFHRRAVLVGTIENEKVLDLLYNPQNGVLGGKGYSGVLTNKLLDGISRIKDTLDLMETELKNPEL